MKQIIRKNTFETNSSSTHSLTLNNQDNIESSLQYALDLIERIDDKEDLYRVLGLLKEVEHLILKELEED